METMERNFAESLAKSWWLLLLRGLVAIAFGVVIWVQPAISLYALVMLFGAFALTDGVFGIVSAFSGHRQAADRWLMALLGLVGIGAGLMTFFVPGLTAYALLIYIGGWALAVGLLQVIAAIRLRKEIEGEWMLGLHGVLSIAFGVLVLVRPGAGAMAVLWLIATYSIMAGFLLVVLALSLRALYAEIKKDISNPPTTPISPAHG